MTVETIVLSVLSCVNLTVITVALPAGKLVIVQVVTFSDKATVKKPPSAALRVNVPELEVTAVTSSDTVLLNFKVLLAVFSDIVSTFISLAIIYPLGYLSFTACLAACKSVRVSPPSSNACMQSSIDGYSTCLST